MTTEIWKNIDFEPGYKVSNLGRVKTPNDFIQNPISRNPKGYVPIKIRRTNHLLHRIVASAFIPNPEDKKFVNHKNGIRDDNRADNLEWATPTENRVKRVNQATNFATRKIIQIDYFTDEQIKIWDSVDEADAHFKANTGQCARGVTQSAGGFKWKYFEEIYDDEEWKLSSLETYEVSNYGRVRNVNNKDRILKTSINGKYMTVTEKNKVIHRLVAEAFIPNPNNLPVVNHKDGNSLNNKVSNLEWVTQQDNVKHAIENNLHNIDNMGHSRPVRQYITDTEYKDWPSAKKAAEALGISAGNICKVCLGCQHTTGGFKWYYVDQLPKIDIDIENITRKVSQIQLDKTVKEWDTIKAASLETGKTIKDIYDVCSGSKRTLDGLEWKFSDEQIVLPKISNSKRKVRQYFRDGTCKDWETLKFAAETLKILESTISISCQNKKETKSEFIWRFIDEISENEIIKFKFNKVFQPVEQYSNIYTMIKKWKNIKEASEVTNIPLNEIKNACVMKFTLMNNKTAGGFIWKYI